MFKTDQWMLGRYTQNKPFHVFKGLMTTLNDYVLLVKYCKWIRLELNHDFVKIDVLKHGAQVVTWHDKKQAWDAWNIIRSPINTISRALKCRSNQFAKSQDVSVIERQGHITNRIRLAELSEQAIHWLNPLRSSWEHAVVLQRSTHSCRRHFLLYLDQSKLYIMTDESSVQLYIFSLAENARRC